MKFITLFVVLFSGCCTVSMSASVKKDWVTDPSLYDSHDMTTKLEFKLSKDYNPKSN